MEEACWFSPNHRRYTEKASAENVGQLFCRMRSSPAADQYEHTHSHTRTGYLPLLSDWATEHHQATVIASTMKQQTAKCRHLRPTRTSRACTVMLHSHPLLSTLISWFAAGFPQIWIPFRLQSLLLVISWSTSSNNKRQCWFNIWLCALRSAYKRHGKEAAPSIRGSKPFLY